tara:strand:+ start:6025 stop:6528 length:504 start_codon:yes stop_codon:yes gene_type:complete
MRYQLKTANKIKVSKSSIGGRGVFATEDISEGEIIEECHFIISGCSKEMENKELARYAFAIFLDNELSPEDNEKISFKIRLLSMFEDENVTDNLISFIKDMGYENLDNLFNSATVLGHGMIYNHSKEYNVNYECDLKNMLFEYRANTNIKKGKELLINYGAHYWKNK